MSEVYKLVSEWDLGLEDRLYSSESSAIQAAGQVFLDHDLEIELEMSFKDALDDNLIYAKEMKYG